MGEKRERKTEEEVLIHPIRSAENEGFAGDIHMMTFLLVCGIIIQMKSGHVEYLDLANLSSFLIADPSWGFVLYHKKLV